MLLGDPSAPSTGSGQAGSGPGGQDAGANRTIEAEFSRWAKAVGLPEKLRTMRQARAQDGEAFALLFNNPGAPGSKPSARTCAPNLASRLTGR